MRNHPRALAAAAVVAVALTGTVGAAATATPSRPATTTGTADQPWRDPDRSPEQRAELLIDAMTFDEKITLILATNDEDFAPLEHLGIPQMRRVDASAGLRGDTGVTAFPVPNAQGATFDTELAGEIGRAIGDEALAKRWNVILGPTLDVDRNGLHGRAAEGFGEDPLVNGELGAAVSAGMESNGVITMLKHFAGYAQESGPRETLQVEIPERALHELYYPPFETAIRSGGADSVMCAYPSVNGDYACQNAEMLGHLKDELGLEGYVATDFNPRTDWVAGINAGVDSQSLFAQTDRSPFTDGRIAAERVDDAAYRMLFALFDSGAYDTPLPKTAGEVVTTAAHQDLAVEAAEASAVLLKNDGLLPLAGDPSVAVIGPAGADTMTGIEGSTYVDPGDFTTPAEAITAQAGAENTTVSQGSLGDVPLPTIPAEAFGDGLQAEFFGNPDYSGDPIATTTTPNVDFAWGNPVDGLPAQWSARWTGTITPTESGFVRFSSLLSGSARVVVDGEEVFDGARFIWDFFFAPQEYTIGGVTELTAGEPVDITVEYSTAEAGFNGPRMTLGWQPESLIPAAAEAAAESDVAIVFANEIVGEAVDRLGMDLVGDQDELIEAVAAANPNTVVVLHTPGPVEMPWLDDVAGVVQGWYAGAGSGESIANVLWGDAEPGGRLPMTFPTSVDQVVPIDPSPSVTYDEGIFTGYKWFDEQDLEPLFPFGHGLSYTTFEYDKLRTKNLNTRAADHSAAATASVRVTVTNTGDRAGSEIVQAYAGEIPTDEVATVEKTLAGFAKVELEPGESETVSIDLDRRALSYWDTDADEWVTPAGDVDVFVGSSSADIEEVGTIHVK